jgi:hypothetical protein
MEYYATTCKLVPLPLYSINPGLRSLYQPQSLYLSSIDIRSDGFRMYLTKIPQSYDLLTYKHMMPVFADNQCLVTLVKLLAHFFYTSFL